MQPVFDLILQVPMYQIAYKSSVNTFILQVLGNKTDYSFRFMIAHSIGAEFEGEGDDPII